MNEPTAATANTAERDPSAALLSVLAFATGALIANLYYAQPLIAAIGPAIGVGADVAGAIVGVTQIGYGIGLFLIVSLADLVENKRLVLSTLVLTALALGVSALARTSELFFAAAFVVGICSTGAQVLLPFAAQLVPLAKRGRVVGNIMAGVLSGVMLARPVSLFVSDLLGWRAVFWLSAVLMIAIGLGLRRMMPRHVPRAGVSYGRILTSMVGLFLKMPQVQRRAAYQALMFGAFSMFWTTVPVMLADRYGMSQKAIALFALAGAGGALAAPLAGRLADRGLIRAGTAGTMVLAGLAFLATRWAATLDTIVPLVVLAVLLDAAVQATQVLSQRIIYSVAAETRGRVNAIYMTMMFFGGALGSVAGTVTYHHGGWNLTALCGGLVGLVMLLLWLTEGAGRGRFA